MEVTNPLFDLLDILAKLAVSILLGGIIGWEREVHDRPAGLRTHVLVCLGSSVYMILSLTFSGPTSDPARIAAQVATGMGFLGAGTIIRHGNAVRGLTTAASLWAVAAIGLCVGRGDIGYLIAACSTLFVFFTLRGLSWIERRTALKRQYRNLVARVHRPRELMPEIEAALDQQGVRVQSWDIGDQITDDIFELRLQLRIPPNLALNKVNSTLTAMDDILAVEWD